MHIIITSECSTNQETHKLNQAGSSKDDQATGGSLVLKATAQSEQGDFKYYLSNFSLLFKMISLYDQSLYFILSSVTRTDKEYLLLDEENLTPAEMRHISWTQYGDNEERSYEEIE